MAPLSVAMPNDSRTVGIAARVVQVRYTGDALPGTGVRKIVSTTMPMSMPATFVRTHQRPLVILFPYLTVTEASGSFSFRYGGPGEQDGQNRENDQNPAAQSS